MSTFKKGDRVKVEFEGVVLDAGRFNVDVCVAGARPGGRAYVSAEHLTRLPDPLPTTVGSVVRDGAGEVWMLRADSDAPATTTRWYCERTEVRPMLPTDWTLIYDAGAQ